MKLLYIHLLAIHSFSLRYKKQIPNFPKFVPKLKTSTFPQQEQIIQSKILQKDARNTLTAHGPCCAIYIYIKIKK